MGSIPECTASLGRRKEQARRCSCSAPLTELCLPAHHQSPPEVQHPQRTALREHTEEVGPTTPEGARGSSSLLGFGQAAPTC